MGPTKIAHRLTKLLQIIGLVVLAGLRWGPVAPILASSATS